MLFATAGETGLGLGTRRHWVRFPARVGHSRLGQVVPSSDGAFPGATGGGKSWGVGMGEPAACGLRSYIDPENKQ